MTGLAALKRLALARAHPLSVQLELTYRCPCRCGFCYNPARGEANALTRSEWEEPLDDLRSLGTLFVALTGGDPMAHPEFFAIAREVRRRNFALTVLTSGLLVDRPRARELARLSPYKVELSLHGASAATHEAVTGIAGSFAAVERAVAHLRAEGVKVRLKTPVTGLNADEIHEISGLASAWGAELLMDAVLTPRDDGGRAPLYYEVPAGALPAMVEQLAEVGQVPPRVSRSEGATACGLGRTTLAIDPEGNVYPCLQWRGSALGNVRQERLESLWRRSPVREAAAEGAVLANQALIDETEGLSSFHFCPALAMQATGDVTGIWPRHRLLAETVHRHRTSLAES